MSPIAILGAVPALIGWLLYTRRMRAAANREIERVRIQSGEGGSLSDRWVSRWTVRGALLGAAWVAGGILIVFLGGDVDPPRGAAVVPVVLVLALVEIIAALGWGAVAQRSIRRWELYAKGPAR
jgi:hypothetical protein